MWAETSLDNASVSFFGIPSELFPHETTTKLSNVVGGLTPTRLPA